MTTRKRPVAKARTRVAHHNMTPYNEIIRETLKVSPERARLVEAYLRMDHGTLDALSHDDIVLEYFHGGISTAIDDNPTGADALAASYGLIDHEHEEEKNP